MRKTCLDMIYQFAQEDERIFFIGSDLGFYTLNEFKEKIPERFIMEGINEAHVIGMATGLALENKIVYVNTIATFLTRRCFEQVALDMCLHNAKVRLIGNGGGFVYAPLGSTHLAIEDIAIFRALPNMTIVSPADENEMKRLMPQTVDYPGPIYIRLAKGYDPIVTNNEISFEIGSGIPMRRGKDALIITTGITLKLAQKAAEKLIREGLDTSILHMPTIKPLDVDKLVRMSSKVKAIVVIEEHSIIGGLGSAVAEVLAETRFPRPLRFKRLGIPDVFPDQYGSQNSLMERYNLTSEAICKSIRELLFK